MSDLSKSGPAPEAAGEPILFDALLTPHRSLAPRGFVILMGFITVVSFSAGLVFFLVGAWPVVGFLGLDVALIYLAFRINYRDARRHEILRLTRRRLVVERRDPWGAVKRWTFQPAWLQVLMDDPPGADQEKHQPGLVADPNPNMVYFLDAKHHRVPSVWRRQFEDLEIEL